MNINNKIVIKLKILRKMNKWDERNYLNDCLNHYIEQNANYERKLQKGDQWVNVNDRITNYRHMALEQIKDRLTIYEVYLLFFLDQDDSNQTSANVRSAKWKALNNINGAKWLSKEKKKKLKRKLYDIQAVNYGLLLELIMGSDLFYDPVNKKEIFPHMPLPESEKDLNKEVVNTDDVLSNQSIPDEVEEEDDGLSFLYN